MKEKDMIIKPKLNGGWDIKIVPLNSGKHRMILVLNNIHDTPREGE
jgi:hypothetical protein